MNVVDAISPAEIGMVSMLLLKRYGPLYADIWKVGLNLSLRISDLLALRYEQLDLEGQRRVGRHCGASPAPPSRTAPGTPGR